MRLSISKKRLTLLIDDFWVKGCVEEELLAVMKALYRHVKSCIGVDKFLSECFCNNLGLMKAGRSVVTYSIQSVC